MNDVGGLNGFGNVHHFHAVGLGFLPAAAALSQTDNDVQAGIFQIQSLSVSLAAITDNGDCFAFQNIQIRVFVIIHLCHNLTPEDSLRNLRHNKNK